MYHRQKEKNSVEETDKKKQETQVKECILHERADKDQA
jgi:hypothetical protein